MSQEQSTPPQKVSLVKILAVFLKVGAFTFGGGYAILPIIQREVVSRQRWVDSATFSDTLIITQSVPGPLALNNSILIGMRLRGIPGGLFAALGMLIPSVLIILFLVSFLLPAVKDNIYVQAVFYGIRPTIMALIMAAAYYLGRELIQDWRGIVLAAALLTTAILIQLHPIIVLLAGGVLGLMIFRIRGSSHD